MYYISLLFHYFNNLIKLRCNYICLQESLEYFGKRRTDLTVGKTFQGVETPSQVSCACSWAFTTFICVNECTLYCTDYLTIIRRILSEPRRQSPSLRRIIVLVFLHKSFVFLGLNIYFNFAYFIISNFHKTVSRHFENFSFVIFTCRWI
jgi:hypothetical protein